MQNITLSKLDSLSDFNGGDHSVWAGTEDTGAHGDGAHRAARPLLAIKATGTSHLAVGPGANADRSGGHPVNPPGKHLYLAAQLAGQGPHGLAEGRHTGRPGMLGEEQLRYLAELADQGAYAVPQLLARLQ